MMGTTGLGSGTHLVGGLDDPLQHAHVHGLAEVHEGSRRLLDARKGSHRRCSAEGQGVHGARDGPCQTSVRPRQDQSPLVGRRESRRDSAAFEYIAAGGQSSDGNDRMVWFLSSLFFPSH